MACHRASPRSVCAVRHIHSDREKPLLRLKSAETAPSHPRSGRVLCRHRQQEESRAERPCSAPLADPLQMRRDEASAASKPRVGPATEQVRITSRCRRGECWRRCWLRWWPRCLPRWPAASPARSPPSAAARWPQPRPTQPRPFPRSSPRSEAESGRSCAPRSGQNRTRRIQKSDARANFPTHEASVLKRHGLEAKVKAPGSRGTGRRRRSLRSSSSGSCACARRGGARVRQRGARTQASERATEAGPLCCTLARYSPVVLRGLRRGHPEAERPPRGTPVRVVGAVVPGPRRRAQRGHALVRLVEARRRGPRRALLRHRLAVRGVQAALVLGRELADQLLLPLGRGAAGGMGDGGGGGR